jgi:hypothetical protein
MFLIAAALLVCASLSFGQGISVIWYYLPPEFGGGPALTGPLCWDGPTLPDGTPVEIRWDLDPAGPGPEDPLPPLCNNPPLCQDGPAGPFNRQGFVLNGGAQGLGEGWFAMESGFASVGIAPNPSRFYLVIRCADGSVHYRSAVYTPAVGGNEYFITQNDWTCFPCIPTCDADEFVTIETAVGSQDPSDQQSVCVHLCAGQTTVLRICRPGGGGVFDPNKPPVTTFVPGCNLEFTNCDEQCVAATFVDPTPWQIGPDGCWTSIVVGTSDGCACFTFEYFLAATIQSFSGVVGDGEVSLSWVTASEVNVNNYQVVRNGVVIANVASENSTSEHVYTYTDATAENGTSYTYNLRVVNSDNSITETPFEFTGTPSFGAAVVTEYALHQNFPNPFNPSTSLAFDVVEKNHVTLKVYNAAGQEVSTLANGEFDHGRHVVSFDAGNLPTGLYFYTVKIGNEFNATKKMLLVK